MTSKRELIESSDVITMFPTLVWKTQLKREQYQRINASILARLDEMMPSVKPGGRSQSDQALHLLDEFAEMVESVQLTAKGILKFLRIGYDAFEITGCWANKNVTGAMHRAHSHPNNYLSGVYYVQTSDGADTINFHDPRIQTGIIRPPVTALCGENTDQVVVQVRDGMLLMFPAWLEHSVDANRSEKTRISISFNMMFSSYTETMSKPLW